jgi:crotonobetainyl-CoA:carnitine CoA-transferase CaiB-like acyl-CoA transferase
MTAALTTSSGKKSLCLNLRDPRGIALVAALVPKVDVVVENFSMKRLPRWGSATSGCARCAGTLFSARSPHSARMGRWLNYPVTIFIAQAYFGVTSMIGKADGTPQIPLVAVGDVHTGVHAALAILAALRYRGRILRRHKLCLPKLSQKER